MEIPSIVKNIIKNIEKNNFEAFIIGGCVRDLLLGKTPHDWDLTSNAKPQEILEIFPEAKYENNFGTVLLPIQLENKKNSIIEITTYRSEQTYRDMRRPEKIHFEDRLDQDLSRRDFTMNALAMAITKRNIPNYLQKYILPHQTYKIIDLFGGYRDIQKKIIRAVGEPEHRFREDALRMMRAVRFYAQLGFSIEEKTERAIAKNARNLNYIAKERVRDELVKILSANYFYNGIVKLHKLRLLKFILPELEDGINVKQAHHHTYTVFKHSIESLKHCPGKEWQVRLAALLHDVGKPKSRRFVKGQPIFYNHEYIGAKITEKIVKRLRLSIKDGQRIVNLVRNHMFYYNVGEVSAASVRRLIAKTGKENLKDLMDVRIADRLGSGVKKAKPYKLRHLEYMIEKVSNDPVSVKMLKINGDDLIKDLALQPGPIVGAILDILLSEVIDDPNKNNYDYLKKRSKELKDLDLKNLRGQAKSEIDKKKHEDDKKIKKEFRV